MDKLTIRQKAIFNVLVSCERGGAPLAETARLMRDAIPAEGARRDLDLMLEFAQELPPAERGARAREIAERDPEYARAISEVRDPDAPECVCYRGLSWCPKHGRARGVE